jgi:ferredoxin
MDNTPKNAVHPSGPVQVNSVKITIDRDLCIGAATCLAIAPEVFALDSDAKAIILSSADTTDDATILDAARGCPTAAIILEDQNGQKLFPK